MVRLRNRIIGSLLSTVFVVGLLVTTSGTVNAAGSGFSSYRIIVQAVLKAAAKATNTPVQDLRKLMGNGKTLAEIITDNNGDVQAVKTAAKTDITDKIKQAVAAGSLSQDQANTLLLRTDDSVDTVLYIPIADKNPNAQMLIGWAVIDAVEQATKLTTVQILKEIAMPNKSLADIVTENGADVPTVTSLAKATITDETKQAVTDGLVPQADADKFIDGLDKILDQVMKGQYNDGKSGLLKFEMRLLQAGSLGALLKTTADQSQISQRDLLAAIHSGKSMAQIAVEHNADPAKIVDIVAKGITARVNALLQKNKVNQTEANALLSGLNDDLTTMLNDPNALQDGVLSGKGLKGLKQPKPGATPAPTTQPTPAATAAAA